MIKLTENTLTDFRKAVAERGTPACGSVCACAASLAAALGCTVCKEENAEELKNLSAISEYLLRMTGEDVKSLAPLEKAYSLPEDAPDRGNKLEGALRIACQVPTDVMYACVNAVEILSSLIGKAESADLPQIGTAIELCRACAKAARLEILSHASRMTDDVFARTLRRECEITLSDFEPKADGATGEIEERLYSAFGM